MGKFKLTKKCQLGFLAIMLLQVNTALAEEIPESNEGDTELATIKVLGTAFEDDFNTAMNAEMIEKIQAFSLQDIFRHEPSITVGGGLPVAQKVYVRGLEDTLLNVSIDGATQAGYIYHHQGRINVEPELVKSVVVKGGAGAATDGAGALGGAIHIKLKDAKDMLREGQRAGGLVKLAYHSNNELWKKHVSAYGMMTDSFGILASFSHNDSGDNYSGGNGDEVDYTKIKQQDVRIKFSGNIAPDHYLSLSYEKYEDDATRYSRPNMGALFHPIYPNIPVPQQTERESYVANYEFNSDSKLVDLKATLYHNDSYLTKQGDQWAVFPLIGPPPLWTYADYYNGQRHGGGVKSRGGDLRNTSTFGRHSITYGGEFRHDEAYFINSAIDLNDEETDIFALYAQADVIVNDVISISAGLRYDDYEYEDNNGFEIDDSQVSPNATINLQATDNLELHAGYAQAFKGVSSPEAWFLEFPHIASGLQSYTGADTTNGDFGVGKLKAEESDNIEIGFKYENGSFAASGELFRQRIENTQVISASTATRYSYLDDVESTGYALRAGYYWDTVSIDIGVSETKPELGDAPLGSAEMGLGTAYGRTWTLGMAYTPNSKVIVGWNGRFVEELDFVQDGQDNKDGYGVVDAYAQWTPTDRLKLGVSVRNLFDKQYYDQGTFFTSSNTAAAPFGLPEPGRDVRLSVSYKL